MKAQVQVGNFTNGSEIIRDLIRREQERAKEVESIRAALIEAETSGEPRRFDPHAFRARMQSDHG